jgi:hypothetical protein
MNKSHFQPGSDAAERGAQGRKRMREISAENRAKIQINIESMLTGLRQTSGREPSKIDEMDAEAMCSLMLQAAKLRDKGQCELEVWREYALVKQASAWANPWPRAAAPATERQA